MLLKAIHSISNGDDNYLPGEIFKEADASGARRLIELGAAVPVRKTVTLSFSSKTASDDFGKELMDKRRLADSDKTIVNGDCQKGAATSSSAVSEDDSHRHGDLIGGAAMNSLERRVQAESGHVVDNSDGLQPVFTPDRGESVATAVHRISCATGLSESDVELRVQAEIERQGSLLPGRAA